MKNAGEHDNNFSNQEIEDDKQQIEDDKQQIEEKEQVSTLKNLKL